METKILEIRDRATYLPVMATKMISDIPKERYHLRRTGYGEDFPLITITMLNGCISQYDAYKWSDNSRTLHEAHKYIQEKYDELKTGDVVDVEFILGESKNKKKSEMGGTE